MKFKNKSPTAKPRQIKETYPHFRRYKEAEGGKKKKALHPKLIMKKENETFEFIGLTESSKRGHHKNYPLLKNPQKGNTSPSYLRDELRNKPISYFSEPLNDYKLSEKDEKIAWKIYHKRKKK